MHMGWKSRIHTAGGKSCGAATCDRRATSPEVLSDTLCGARFLRGHAEKGEIRDEKTTTWEACWAKVYLVYDMVLAIDLV